MRLNDTTIIIEEISEAIVAEGRAKEEAHWTSELKAAKPGDVVITLDKQGFRHIFSVRDVGSTCLSGDSFLANSNGEVFGITLGIAARSFSEFADVAELQLMSF